jgi:RecA/RadA recombinase
MAVQARMFASMMQLVKGLLGEKNCTFVATNQLRMAPGVTHGDPIYEPAGQAIQFYSDNRTRIMRVSPNTAGVPSGSGAKFSTEPGLRGGKDQYVYSKIVNTKNKAFPPFRESMLRIRFLKDGSPGDGICETWDCASYLQATGQMVQRGQTITMNLMPVKAKGRQIDIFEQGERTTYPKFKEMVEDPKYKRMIWKHCFHQMQGGYGFDLEREAAARLIAKASRESVLEEPAGIDA